MSPAVVTLVDCAALSDRSERAPPLLRGWGADRYRERVTKQAMHTAHGSNDAEGLGSRIMSNSVAMSSQ